MKYLPVIYAKALVSVLKKEPVESHAKISANFVKLLKKNGDLEKAWKVIEEAERIILKESGGRSVKVIIPREIPKTLSEKIEKSFGSKDRVGFEINRNLIAGTKIIFDGEKIMDNSLATTLKRMFI